MSLRSRFLSFVRRDPSGCWLWTGAKDRDGYGVIADAGRTLGAHRVSYELHKRPLPPGALIMHSCDTPPCVNPAHLSVGTKRSNAADMTAKGRRATKLTRLQVLEIRARVGDGESTAEVAAAFGVSTATVQSIVSRRSWRGV
jgi:hypothetical protein